MKSIYPKVYLHQDAIRNALYSNLKTGALYYQNQKIGDARISVEVMLPDNTDLVALLVSIRGLDGLKKTNCIAGYAWNILSTSKKGHLRSRPIKKLRQ